VTPDDEEKLKRVLVTMARIMVRKFMHDVKNTAVSHFYDETKCRRTLKADIIKKDLNINPEEYMSVSTLSFYSLFMLNCIIRS
jgi:hypothetical protein